MKKESSKTVDDGCAKRTISRNSKAVYAANITGGQLPGTNLVLIEPDLANLFPDSESVNRALRLLADSARAATAPKPRRKR